MNMPTVPPEKEKKLKYVAVYDTLFQLIQNGVYPVGSQLPSEPDLAVQLDVSRMTLRRALAILQEDGLIQNIRGKGNFVQSGLYTQQPHTPPKGIAHPFAISCTLPVEGVELEFRIEPPSASISQSLGRKTSAVVIVDRWYKHQGEVFSYSLSFVPIEVIAAYQVDLANPKELEVFLQETVYHTAHTASCLYSYTDTGNFTSTKYALSDSDAFILMQGKLLDTEGLTLVSSKHYVPSRYFRLFLDYTAVNTDITDRSDYSIHPNQG